MLDYILSDFVQSRITFGDDSIGGMVICDSAEQARELHRQFQRLMAPDTNTTVAEPANDAEYRPARVAEDPPRYGKQPLSAALILHDEGDKATREAQIKDYKRGRIDLLFVYNMLLTGFDAPRLKKLYFGRVIKNHNLLQALTRVNRRYGQFRYGYVVDFADIQTEFDKANRDYYDELTDELGDDMPHYSNLFKNADEIRADIEAIREALFDYSLDDAELFSQQVGKIQDRGKLLAIVKALAQARNPVTTNQGFKSFVPSKGYGTSFVYYAVERSLSTIIQYASGSTFVEISGGVLKSVHAVLSDKSATNAFCNLIEPIVKRQQQAEVESLELTQLRDWLLPLLMNGQVRVA